MNDATKPRTVIVETSTRIGQIALADGAKILGERRLDEARRHTRDLAPALRGLLDEQGWQPRDVELIVVGHGPGSYTGLRVGIISAKTFAYVTRCAFLAVPTMAAIATQTPDEVREVDVFVDAQQDRAYWQRYARDKEVMSPRTELSIVPFADWLADPGKAAWVSGPGLRGKEERVPEACQMVEESLWLPAAESLLRLALPRFAAEDCDDFWSVEPLYLRPSAAEEQWDRNPKQEA